MRIGYLDVPHFPLNIYKSVNKSGSRIEHSLRLSDELIHIGNKISKLPLKFASLVLAVPSKSFDQEFHEDSDQGERAILYLTDVVSESNGPIEFLHCGKVLGRAGTFVHYSAKEIHRGCISDIHRYALALAFDNSSKSITTIGGAPIVNPHYITAIGRLRADVNPFLLGTPPNPWKLIGYTVPVPTGTPPSITPSTIFNPFNKNEMYYFFDNGLELTQETTVNIIYNSRPTNSIVVFNGTLQNLKLNITISGGFLAENDSAALQVRNDDTLASSIVIPGEAVSYYITAQKVLYFFPGILQLVSSEAINTTGDVYT